ncbi:MAG: DUF5050 domain-containing protein [Caldisericia bacterium]|nr:DUF5050 domain-containing protein [Caldisericia bacterium]
MRFIVRLYRCFVISIVLLIFGVSYLGCKQNVPVNPEATSQNRGNSIGNLLNGGFVAQDQDWIYYASINPQGLYKVPINGKKKQKVCDDIGSSINVLSDWIYYSNATDNSTIYKVKTDGSERQKLYDEPFSSYLNIAGDWLYFMNENKFAMLFRIRTDGSEYEAVVEY